MVLKGHTKFQPGSPTLQEEFLDSQTGWTDRQVANYSKVYIFILCFTDQRDHEIPHFTSITTLMSPQMTQSGTSLRNIATITMAERSYRLGL